MTESLPDLHAVAAVLDAAIVPSTRIDGWSAPRQRRFLEAIADGGTVADACATVGLSPQSAYAFRRRSKGQAFDLGWKAADLLARERVAADLLLRATAGQVVETTRADGSTVTRHHYDNRLAVQMLNRLDRYADAAEATAAGHAARMVAGDFDAYLDLVGTEGGPARAGLFVLAREKAPAAALEPVLALARADRHLRCGTLAPDVEVADLDPARRAGWTAEQWARAEAAGLIVLAPPSPPPPPASTHQPLSTSRPVEPEDRPDPVWWCDVANDWRTRFPPPEAFAGAEEGEFGDDGYERELDGDEIDRLEAPHRAWVERRREHEEGERDAWFAACAAPGLPRDEADPRAPAANPVPEHAASPVPPAPCPVGGLPENPPRTRGGGGPRAISPAANPATTAPPLSLRAGNVPAPPAV